MRRPDERDYAFGRDGSNYKDDLEKWADWAEDRIAELEKRLTYQNGYIAKAISVLKGRGADDEAE